MKRFLETRRTSNEIRCSHLRLLSLSGLLLLGLLGSFGTARASHYAGTQIIVDWISGENYRFTQAIYRDCAGIALGTTTTVNLTPAVPTTSVTLTRTMVTDITPLCPGQASSCNNGGGPYGIEEHIFVGTVTNLQPNTSYRVDATALCCRNSAITTVTSAGSQQLYIYSNFRTGIQNSSPRFLNRPVGFFCANQPASLSQAGSDPDGDAIVYSLQACNDLSLTDPVTYAPGFTATNPITSSNGVTINPNTGLISFTPTIVGQVAVVCVRADEFRNGQVIGSVTRDIQVRILNCNNTPPVVAPIANVVVPVGQQFCTPVAVTDANNNNITVTVTSQILPPATFVLNSSGPGFANGTFCFTPTALQAGNTYTVSINAVDNACPSPGTGFGTFNITVPIPCNMTASATGTAASCGASNGSATVSVLNGTAPITYSWTGPNNYSSFTQSISGLAAGTYTVLVVDGNSCVFTTSYTVASGASTVGALTTTTSTTCGQSNGAITASAFGGVAPYTYSFDGGGFTASGTRNGLAAGVHSLVVRDANNCSYSTTVTVGAIADIVAPSITCPGNISVGNDLGVCGAAVNFANASATDNCGLVTVVQSGGQASGSIFAVGTSTVSFNAVDGSGNTAACSFTVTVLDNEAPAIICQSIQVSPTTGITSTITAAQVLASAADNCAIATMTVTPNSFTCAQAGQTIVTMVTVTDINGNVSTCTANVQVLGNGCNQPPVPVCQNLTVNANGSCLGNAAAFEFNGGSTDPNGDALTFFVTPIGPYALGTTAVVLSVSDGQYTATCTATITVVDVTPPTIACPSNLGVSNSNGQCSAAVSYNVTVNDNCSATVAVTPASGSVFAVGTSTVNAVATDGAGNTAACAFQVTVTDNEAPQAVCQNITAMLDANGAVCVSPLLLNNGNTDNCGVDTAYLSQCDFICTDIGNNTVTLTVIDIYGNSSVCTSIVTIVDGIAPIANCQAVNLVLDANGNATVTAIEVDDFSYDNCDVASLTIDNGSFNCANLGDNTVVLTVTDNSGNASTCAATVNVSDTRAPLITCPADIGVSNAPGMCSAAVTYNANATDNCSVSGISYNPASGSTFALGTTTVTATATDGSGNSASCSFTVTVSDNTAPVITCPGNITQSNDLGLCSAVVSYIATATDDCSVSGISYSPASGSTFAVGTTTVTATATDGSGNASSCTFTVTVNDNQAPSALCSGSTVALSNAGTGSISVSNINNGSSDNCAIASMSLSNTGFSCANLGANTVTLTVVDIYGNSSMCSGIVTVVDNIAPTITCPANVSVACVRDIPTANTSLVTAQDNCTVISIAHVGDAVTGTGCAGSPRVIIRTYRATDQSGNTATCAQTLTAQATAVVANASNNVIVIPAYQDSACATISVVGSGGCAPYTYLWNNGPTTTNQTVCPTVSTVYYVTVTDAQGCTGVDSVRVCVLDITCTDRSNNGQTGNGQSGNGVNQSPNAMAHIAICHVPPGRPQNAMTQCLPVPAARQHILAGHGGDYLGGCGNLTTRNCNLGGNSKMASQAGNALDAKPSLSIHVFPNPTNGNTTVEVACRNCGDEGTYALKVSDIYGKQIVATAISLTLGEGSVKLDMSQFAAGVYLVTVENGDLRIVERVVKQ